MALELEVKEIAAKSEGVLGQRCGTEGSKAQQDVASLHSGARALARKATTEATAQHIPILSTGSTHRPLAVYMDALEAAPSKASAARPLRPTP